jgi:hypothetical protein
MKKTRWPGTVHDFGVDNLRDDFNVKLLPITQAGSSPALKSGAAQKCVAA